MGLSSSRPVDVTPQLLRKIEENGVYHVRLVTKQLRGHGSEDKVQLSQFVLIQNGEPIRGGRASNPGGHSVNGEVPENVLFSDHSKWIDLNIRPLVLSFKKPVLFDEYRFTTANDCPGRDPVGFSLEVALEENLSKGTAWYRLDYQDPDTSAVPMERHTDSPTYSIAYFTKKQVPKATHAQEQMEGALDNAPRRFQELIFTPLMVRNRYQANSVQLSGIILFSGGRPVHPISAKSPDSHSPHNEGACNLIKEDGSKWLDFTRGGSVVIKLKEPTAVDSYTLVTANDSPERDPVSWELRGKVSFGGPASVIHSMKHVSAPIQRHHAYPIYSLQSVSEISPMNAVGGSTGAMETRAKTYFELVWTDEGQLLKRWCEVPRAAAENTQREDNVVPLEYEKALSLIAVRSKLMSVCGTDQAIAQLKAQGKDTSAPSSGSQQALFEEWFQGALNRLSPPNDQFSKWQLANAARAAASVHESLVWEKDYFVQALEVVTQMETSWDGVRGIIDNMEIMSSQCSAMKRQAAVIVIRRAGDLVAKPCAGGMSRPLQSDSDALWDRAMEFLDEWKQKAFFSTFLEPARLALDILEDDVARDDVAPHGVNTYGSLVLSILGCKLPQVPYLEDEVKGIIDFVVLRLSCLGELWNLENMGKSASSIPACCPGNDEIDWDNVHQALLNGETGFIFKGSTPKDIANAAISFGSDPKQREKMAVYMEQFAQYFSGEAITEKLFLNIANDLPSRRALYEAVPDEERGEGNDVRHWVYDPETYAFDRERAQLILYHSNIMKKPTQTTNGEPTPSPN